MQHCSRAKPFLFRTHNLSKVVVMLSRNQSCEMITIVASSVDFAIRRMWKVICTGTRWTSYIEHLLEKLTVNVDPAQDGATPGNAILDVAALYPYRVCDITLPLESTGFVYLLVSTTNFERTYCGQTECLSRRINEHNSGYSSVSTAPGMSGRIVLFSTTHYSYCFL